MTPDPARSALDAIAESVALRRAQETIERALDKLGTAEDAEEGAA